MARTKVLLVSSVLAVLLLTSGCFLTGPKVPEPEHGSLRVTVVNAVSNDVVSAANVQIGTQTKTTDVTGVSEFKELLAGTVTISVLKDGYEAQQYTAVVQGKKDSVVTVAVVPSAYKDLTMAIHWDTGHDATFHAGNVVKPVLQGGALGTTSGHGTLTLTGEPATYSNAGASAANSDSGTIVLWMIPQTAMNTAPQDVYTVIDILTTTPAGRTDSGFHVWWGWGGFQFKAHANEAEVASVWYSSVWQANEYHALTLTWDKTAGKMAIYADGDFVRDIAFPGVPAVADVISFGTRHAGTQPFIGLTLDKVMFFSRALPEGDIQALLSDLE